MPTSFTRAIYGVNKYTRNRHTNNPSFHYSKTETLPCISNTEKKLSEQGKKKRRVNPNPKTDQTTMATLPWDIIVNVLSRLSVKDLLRYKSVSKPWCSLIDDQDFIKMHLKNSMETGSNLGVVLRDCDLHWVDLESLDSAVKLRHPIGGDGHGTEVLGSCHGLLVLLNIDDDVALWNPSTRRYRKLPISNIEFPDGILPCFQFIVYGFGYDPVSNDYKLVRMVQFFGNEGEDSFDSEVKVYSAKSNTWKRIRDFPYYLRYKHGFGVLSNNALHWVVSRKPLSDVSNLVFAVDLVTEEYREVPLPEFEGEGFHMNVEVLGGSLCLLCNYVSDDPNADWGSGSDHVDMWMMKEYGVRESWTKFCTVVPSDGIGPFNYVLPIAYLKCGNQVLMNKNGEKFVVYDLDSEKAWDKKISGVRHHFETCLCVGSLVGLDGNNGRFGWKLGGEDKKKKKKRKKKKKKKKKNKKQSKKKQRDDFLSQGFNLAL